MYNYLKSEMYRGIKQKSTLIFFMISAGLLILMAILVLILSSERYQSSFTVAYHGAVMTMILIGLPIITAVFADSVNKPRAVHQQIVAGGQKRLTVFAGDYIILLIRCFIYAIAMTAVACTILCLVPALFSQEIKMPEREQFKLLLEMVAAGCIVELPFCAAALGIGYLMKSKGQAVIVFIVLYYLLPVFVIPFMHFFKQQKILYAAFELLMPYYQFSRANYGNPLFWVCVVLHTAVWLAVAGLVYSKRDI